MTNASFIQRTLASCTLYLAFALAGSVAAAHTPNQTGTLGSPDAAVWLQSGKASAALDELADFGPTATSAVRVFMGELDALSRKEQYRLSRMRGEGVRHHTAVIRTGSGSQVHLLRYDYLVGGDGSVLAVRGSELFVRDDIGVADLALAPQDGANTLGPKPQL